MRVTGLPSRRISFGTGTLRDWVIWASPVLSAVDVLLGWDTMFHDLGLLGLPFIVVSTVSFVMVAFTQRKQGWHDMMAGTLVVRTGAKFETPPTAKPTAPP